MAKLKKVLFALLLTTAAILSAPKDSFAGGCYQCSQTSECLPCCRCAGYSLAECGPICF